jgi:NTE family protein
MQPPSGCDKEKGIGLALSGGGFRAAFFHVGVLARLAEMRLLHQVEVISTVSGGSIVGVLYYLRLKRLLETKADAGITDEDYLDLVADVERRLRSGAQKNVRARVFANLVKNAEMLKPSYSRSDRTGDLYDRFLYKEAWGLPRPSRSLGREEQIALRELLIQPAGAENFDPDCDNAGRRHKVPILVINATALNSGHNWRFEAVRMGETLPVDPERSATIADVDKNMRLQQAYFDTVATPPEPGLPRVPDDHQKFPLAKAVAASAGVPGVFHPLSISGLYQDIRVQLVDGGVQDNQGVQALHDQGCSQLVISDASGQMQDKDRPGPFAPLVLLRSSSIARDRIRDEQLVAAVGGGAALMHLRSGLEAESVPPSGNPEDARQPGANLDGPPTYFGVDRVVQDRLAKVRTDLDYFSDREAASLELDGYLIAEASERLDELATDPPLTQEWQFGSMQEAMTTPDDPYKKELGAAQKVFFRSLWLKPATAGPIGLTLLAVLALAFCALLGLFDDLLGWSWPLRALLSIAVLGPLALWVWANLKPRMPWLYFRRP